MTKIVHPSIPLMVREEHFFHEASITYNITSDVGGLAL